MSGRATYHPVWRSDRVDVLPPSAEVIETRNEIAREVKEGTESELLRAAEAGQFEADLSDSAGKYVGAIVRDLRLLKFKVELRGSP